jgi:hypothetical protein
MEFPEMLKAESLTRLVQGAVVGCAATLAVGFGWGGWMLGSTASTLAEKSASSAVVAAVAPICVEHFQRGPDAASKMIELKKTSTWQQAAFIEKGGWAVMPGSTSANYGVTSACATMLNNLK